MGLINRNQGRGTSVTSGGSVYRSLEATVYGLVSQEEAEDTSDLSPVLIDKDLKLWTQAADPGESLPEGGTTGQALVKASNDDYDVEWATPHELPSGGSTGQVLKKTSGTDYATEWGSIPNDLPSGGSTGQVLAKASGSEYDVGWNSPHYVPSGGASGQVLAKASGTDYDTQWVDQSALGQPVKAIDFSQWGNSEMEITLADNSTITYSISFDGSGNPTRFEDGDGNYVTITW